MKDKKKVSLFIISIMLVIFSAIAITYSFFTSSSGTSNDVNGNTGKLNIIYSISENISGMLVPTVDKNYGIISTAYARLAEDSAKAKMNMYITPNVVGDVANSTLKWSVEGTLNGNIVYANEGNFDGAVVNKPIKIVDAYALSTTDTEFKIYIWVDGSVLNEIADDNNFVATISADSVPVTSEF